MLIYFTKHNIKRLLKFLTSLAIIILGYTVSLRAEQLNDTTFNNIGKQVFILEDKNNEFLLSDVQKIADSAFQKGTKDILNLGNTSSTWWIKIPYKTKANIGTQLIIDAPSIEHIEAFTTSKNNDLVYYKTGSLAPKSANVIIGNNFVFNLPLEDQVLSKTIYLKIKSNNILLVPIKITTTNAVWIQQPTYIIFTYICIGLLIGLLLYNLFLYFSIKDQTYLYYVFYVLFLSVYVIFYLLGFSFALGDKFRIFINTYPHLWFGLSLIFFITFSKKFLIIEKQLLWFQRAIKYLLYGAFIIVGCSAFGYKSLSANLTQLISLFAVIIVSIGGFFAYKNGFKHAKYFVLAWSIVGISSTIVILSLADVLNQTQFTMLQLPFTSVIELLILSFALGDRYSLIMKAEQKMRDENIMLIKNQNEHLEESVQERTILLNHTIRELEDSNAIKNKLFSIIAHDLKSPLNSLIGILSLNDMKALTMDELGLMLAENKKSIDSIANTINNLLHWAKAQMEGTIIEKKAFNLSQTTAELLHMYLPLIDRKEIILNYQADYKGLVHADPNHINLVIRNLMDNAIKFTRLQGQIDINIQESPNGVLFSISNEIKADHNIDLTKLQGEKITTSTVGTQNEKGVGLGIFLCHEYIRHNDSELKINIQDNKIVFSFELKN